MIKVLIRIIIAHLIKEEEVGHVSSSLGKLWPVGYERVVNVKDLPSTGQTAENLILNTISVDCT